MLETCHRLASVDQFDENTLKPVLQCVAKEAGSKVKATVPSEVKDTGSEVVKVTQKKGSGVKFSVFMGLLRAALSEQKVRHKFIMFGPSIIP